MLSEVGIKYQCLTKYLMMRGENTEKKTEKHCKHEKSRKEKGSYP